MNSDSRLTALTTGAIDSEIVEMKRFYDYVDWVMFDVSDKAMRYETPTYRFASDKAFSKVSVSIMKSQIRDMIKAINKSNLVKGEIKVFLVSAKPISAEILAAKGTSSDHYGPPGKVKRVVIELSFYPVFPMNVVSGVNRDIEKMRRILDQRIEASTASAAAPAPIDLSVAIAAQAQALAEIAAEVEDEPSEE